MYVCLCNAVTDRQIRQAFADGRDSFPELQDALGVATCCGSCEDCARDLLDAIATESRGAARLPAAA